MGISIKAVAFDLDGTLYPNYRLYRRLFFQLFLYPRFFAAFMKTRHQLHLPEFQPEPNVSFHDEQASLMAALLKKDKETIKKEINCLVYQDWEKRFSGIKLFPKVKETLAAFRTAGLKLALLSDFPPKEKIIILGLDDFFDCVLSTEETGALKPSGIPFAALVRTLAVDPDKILYVGNSPRYDAEGARLAGMKAALIRRSVFSTGYARDNGGADFVFKDYSKLQEYVLG